MKVAVYLDTDCNGNDLLDSAGNNITAGWYLIDWPNGAIGEAANQVPFDQQQAAVKAGWVGE